MVANPHEGLTLSLLEFASLSMGLSLHPRRAPEVFACFGLDERSGSREIDAWEGHLAKDGKDAAACAQMRARMRGHWERWAESNPVQKQTAGATSGSMQSVGPSTSSQSIPVAAEAALGPPGATLSLIEYASLTMGLELLPHRADGVCDVFALRTEVARAREASLWDKHLASHAADLAAWKSARERMRDHWRRWEEANPRPTTVIVQKYPPRKHYTPPARFRRGEVKVVASYQPPETRLAILDWAALSVRLERPHADRRVLFAEVGLDEKTGPQEIEAWKARLAANPSERARVEEIRADLRTARKTSPELAATGSDSGVQLRAQPSPPAPAVLSLETFAEITVEWEIDPSRAEEMYVAAGFRSQDERARAEAPWRAKLSVDHGTHAIFEQRRTQHRAARLSEMVLGLADYAALCVELDLNPDRGDAIHGFFGLYDEVSRTRVHDVWQSRFERDPSARAAWFAAMEMVRQSRAQGTP